MDERDNHASPRRASDLPGENHDANTAGWNFKHRRYQCRDGVILEVPKRGAVSYDKDENSEIPCEKLFIGNVRFSRDMREIIEGEDAIRTIIFPKTIRVVKQWAFFEN